jgi:hypothetical protein
MRLPNENCSSLSDFLAKLSRTIVRRTVAVTGRRASNTSPRSGALRGSAEHHLDAFVRLPLCISGITVDPQILRQGKLVNLEVEIMRRSQRHPPQRSGFVVLHGALPSQDREIVQLPELGRPMEERADIPYLERRDPQLFLELTPERGLGAFPGSTWPPGRATAPGTTLFVGFRSSARTVASLRTRAATHSIGCRCSLTLRLSLTPLLPNVLGE